MTFAEELASHVYQGIRSNFGTRRKWIEHFDGIDWPRVIVDSEGCEAMLRAVAKKLDEESKATRESDDSESKQDAHRFERASILVNLAIGSIKGNPVEAELTDDEIQIVD